MEKPSKWQQRFLDLAQHISTWSKDPSTKVGAIIVDDDNRIISVGYNGFPKGVSDTEERYADRNIKYKLIVHGERNAILFAQQSLKGKTLYTWPFGPCPVCAGIIIQSGISKVIFPGTNNPRWVEDIELSKKMFKESGVIYIEV